MVQILNIEYSKCPEMSNTLFHTFFFYQTFVFMQSCLKTFSGMANSVDPYQIAPEGAVFTTIHF